MKLFRNNWRLIRRTTNCASLLCGILIGVSVTALFGGVTVKELKCEYAPAPMGIETQKPRLSWILESTERAQRQTAYQVLVATSVDLLKEGKADLWDSGVVKSDQSVNVPYNGKRLESGQRCFWTVRVWDKDGKASDWSKPAWWEMGLLNQQDWKASWIGYLEGAAMAVELFPTLKWVWYPEGDPLTGAPAATRYFRKTITLPSSLKIAKAAFSLTADDQFVLYVNGKEAGRSSGKKDAWKQIVTADVTSLLKPGRNSLAISVTNSGFAAGLIGCLMIESGSQEQIKYPIDGSWKSGTSEQSGWTGVEFDDSGWQSAKELCAFGGGPWRGIELTQMGPTPFLRKTIEINKPIKKARLYASALGLYEFHINGKKVGNDYFTPGWTDYTNRVQYQVYDVTDILKKGINALGIILGDGWYAGYVGLGGRNRYGQYPLALAQINVEYSDGTKETFVTDTTWKAKTGPILYSDLLMGERYDARLELVGWDLPDYSDTDWRAVFTRQPKSKLVPTIDEPVRKTQELKPISLTEPKKGIYVYDLGQNMVGWARLRISAPAGTEIRLRFAEMLNPDGTVYTANLRGAKATDYYICKGKGVEVYEPRFTFHGFRYVELTGAANKPGMDAITGIVVHSDTPPTGKFACSEPLLNKLQSNIVWGQRGNFLSVPTDCPQRDERLGWMGDAQVFVWTAAYNMDVARFFTKWMIDVRDAQRPNGAFTDVSPFVAAGAGTAAWGDAGVICPWAIYITYGDKKILEDNYEAGAKWIEYLIAHSKNLLRPAEGYGDWLSIKADTPKDVLATAYFALSAKLMANYARVLGKTADIEKYERLFEDIKAAFNKAYVKEDGRIKGDTQTCYVLALAFDLLPQEKRALAARYLVEDIRKRGNHLSTGFVGVGNLLHILTENGYLDVAYDLLHQETFPSWLYPVLQGATTIWERWDGWTKEKGFQDPGMNSFNHYAFGSVGRWMYEVIGGIAPEAENPGYKRTIIRPRPGGKITYAKAEYKSLYGRISTDWSIKNDKFQLTTAIPVNTTALVYIPCDNVELIKESSRPAKDIRGGRFLKVQDGSCVFEVGSGIYKFESPFKPKKS